MTLQANLFASDRSQAKNLVYKSDVYKSFCKMQGLLTGIGLHKNLTGGGCDSVMYASFWDCFDFTACLYFDSERVILAYVCKLLGLFLPSRLVYT